MNVEIVKKKTTQHFCNGRVLMPAGIMKRKYLIVIKIKWYSYDPTFFQNLVFYDQNEYWRNSSSYKVCMLFDVADFTLSLNTEITYSVLDAYYPNTAIDAIFFLF